VGRFLEGSLVYDSNHGDDAGMMVELDAFIRVSKYK
jgi:hypothetical protein